MYEADARVCMNGGCWAGRPFPHLMFYSAPAALDTAEITVNCSNEAGTRRRVWFLQWILNTGSETGTHRDHSKTNPSMTDGTMPTNVIDEKSIFFLK